VLLLHITFGLLIRWACSTTWPPLDLKPSTPTAEIKFYKIQSDEE
jgi:hypothetical protein